MKRIALSLIVALWCSVAMAQEPAAQFGLQFDFVGQGARQPQPSGRLTIFPDGGATRTCLASEIRPLNGVLTYSFTPCIERDLAVTRYATLFACAGFGVITNGENTSGRMSSCLGVRGAGFERSGISLRPVFTVDYGNAPIQGGEGDVKYSVGIRAWFGGE